MATTRLNKHHISKGKSIPASLKDRFDYGQDPEKTEDGELIRSYECDHKTAYAEFTIAKARYQAITGREQKKNNDVLCYQIRQSFAPGEIDEDTALNVGYETAMRWTKGSHAFFVCVHVDRSHIHNHIYYSAVDLACTRKFNDFFCSARALQRLSDRVCIENNLSVIIDPKQKSKGRYQHYGQWLGANKPVSYKERLKAAIDTALEGRPDGFDAFLASMSSIGFHHKWVRAGALSFCADGRKRFTRLRASTLGEGYGLEDIRSVINGTAPLSDGRSNNNKADLIVDIKKKIAENKGPAYERWAKVYNLKQMAAALQYLQENKLTDYPALEGKTNDSVDAYHEILGRLKDTEAAIKHNASLKAAIADYAKTRAVFNEYKAKKYSNKFLAEHEAEINVHRAAKATMRELLNGRKLPKMDVLKSEWQALIASRKSLYPDYREARKSMREALAIKTNIDYLLGFTDGQRNKEIER